MEGVRRASHAGTWYSRNPEQLNAELTQWLSTAQTTQPEAKAIIGPHAGYAYSGPTAAWAYKHINPQAYRRVFLLGPSHHVHIPGCALPCSAAYATPLGDLPVDQETVVQLVATAKFLPLNKEAEEDEHSLELHLPYIRKVFEGCDVRLVPIMVGAVQAGQEKEYGQILAEHFRNPENLFIVSSDFCHWGLRFGYSPYDQSKGEIHQSIESMDREGMELIEQQDPNAFRDYLKRTKNTICGRHPISVLLETIQAAGVGVRTQFVQYAQSERVTTQRSSSVSYASSVTFASA